MPDIKAPKISSMVVGRNRVVLQAIDKEIYQSLDGSYSGINKETGREYWMSLAQDRSEDVFDGWLIEKHHCLDEIPLNSEIWNIFGKIDYSDMSVQGTIQRASSSGNLLGVMTFNGQVANNIILQIVGRKGDFILQNVNKDLVKPAIRS